MSLLIKSNTLIEEFKVGYSNLISKELSININEETIGKLLDNTTLKNKYSDISNLYIPTDIIKNFPLNKSFDLLVSQGYIKEENSFNENIQESQYIKSNLDNFNSNSQNGISFYSENFSPILNKVEFESFFEHFSNFYKLISTPLYDRTNYIVSKSNDLNSYNTFYFLNEPVEKPCTDILDGIKNMYPKFKWKEFEDDVDYNTFLSSNFKSILFKINKIEIKEQVVFSIYIRIMYRSHQNYNINKKRITFTSDRFLLGYKFNFEPYVLKNKIKININYLHKLNEIAIYDIIPFQFTPYLSTIKLNLKILNGETDSDLIEEYLLNNNNSIVSNNIINTELDRNNYNYLADITFTRQTEIENSNIAYTYESKSSIVTKINLKLNNIKELLKSIYNKNNTEKTKDDFFYFEYSFELKKNMLNFESVENEYEFGYLLPSGIIYIEEKQSNYTSMNYNRRFITTNQVFYNLPQIDNTTPFIIIAFTYVIYGYLFIQMLNKLLNLKESFLKQLLNKFISRIRCKIINK